jgi:hypothetical protein
MFAMFILEAKYISIKYENKYINPEFTKKKRNAIAE